MRSINTFRARRLARAWSQEQLAEMSGLSTRTVQRIENGEQPSLETLSALAAVFEVSVAELSGAEANEECGNNALDQRIAEARQKLAQEGRYYRSVITAIIVCLILFTLNRVSSPASHWSFWVAGIWCTLLVVRGMRIFIFNNMIAKWHQKRLQQMLRK
ncbi:helix-turn-helix domain-containing protein [Edwardsiella tarda]|uniref:helix-turn-helix domain-containing protein n=1 Tax=Edwardsiella tarda TaxID=636 RepID=UPI00063BDCAA|nr:helix-turn-helix domain-containing protein [Edwardsiella tarda]AKH89010.1 helix-turn-helix domain-containing protein [Edwardsiella tarda]